MRLKLTLIEVAMAHHQNNKLSLMVSQ